MNISWSEFKSLKKSFWFAIKGLIYCVKNERNMRIHICVASNVFLFALIFGLTKIEFIVLILTFALMFFCEIVNTSIETFVNLTSPAYSSLAKIAKDVAAGGVFLTSIVSVVVGFFLFGDFKKLIITFSYIFNNIWIIILFCCSIFFSFVFVFKSFKFFIYKHIARDEDKVKIYKPRKRDRLNL